MTIIVFLVDTSASMCQRAHVNGVQKTYLDIAKGAVETFLKFRQRSQDCMGDRYMLLTFEDPPNNVKAGWKENHATFMNELKNLQSNGLTSMGEALKNAFDLLNLNRMQSGIDTYGQGRCPFYLEPSVIIVLTDGGKYAFRNGVHQEIILPLHAQMPGTKLTKEPFRWDQRLFSLVLRMPGNRVEERADGKVPHDDSMIEKMCEVTGGRSYKIKSHYVLNQCIESLVQKVQPGVVIHFDQLITNNGDTSTSELQFQSTKRMIYVPKQHPSQKTFPVGYWPIPEPYWPDPKLTNLPPRDAHPKIKIISPCCDEPQILRNFPIDKYELEASPLTLQILSKKESNKVWPLIVSTGLQGEMPFGYLKPNSTMPIVHVYVLPYNYQMLLPLINDLFHKFNLNPPNDWVYKFTNYVKTIPQYYCPFLRRALATTPNVPYQLVQYILPENLDSYLCPAVANYLKQMKNTAKQDQENLCMRVLKQLKQPKPAYHQLETAKLISGQSLQKVRDIVTHPMLKDAFSKMHSEIHNYDNYTIVIPTIIQTASTKHYRNPYDIPRRDLIDEIARMREIFFRVPPTGICLSTKDSGHCLPISDMGNYQEYLKNKETPLRELEPTNVRQHMFGNPYKKDKNMVMVDEADLNDMAPLKSGGPGLHQSSHMKKSIEQGSSSRLTRKRKAGPIRKDYVFKRSALDNSSTSSHSVARDSVHTLSDMSSDEESSTTITSSSDNEDDAEDCLVMALDNAESESAEVIGSAGPTVVAIVQGVSMVCEVDDKKTDRQSCGESDTAQSMNATQLTEECDTLSQPKSDRKAITNLGSVAVPASQTGIATRVQHNHQPSNVNHPGDEVLASTVDAKIPQSQPPSTIIKQSITPITDDPSQEHPLIEDMSDSLPSAKKRQLEHEGQLVCSDDQPPDGDSVHNRKKPRVQQQESPIKTKIVCTQQYSDASEQQKKTSLVDTEPAVPMPESSEHTLSSSVAKVAVDVPLAEQLETNQQRCPVERSEIQEQQSEPQQNQVGQQSNIQLAQSDEITSGSESPKLPTVETNDTPEQPIQHEQSDITPPNTSQAPALERSDEQQEIQRELGFNVEASKNQLELVDPAKARQSKLGKQSKQLEQSKQQQHVAGHPEHPDQLEVQESADIVEPKLKIEDDAKEPEHSSTILPPVPVVEPSLTVVVEPSVDRKIEPESQPEQRKPPLQQPLEPVHQQRPIQRNQTSTQWSIPNTVSSISEASSSDMADVQKISNILKTCHNGGDEERDKNRDAQFDDESVGERPTVLHESGRPRMETIADPDMSPSIANGALPAESAIVTNGCGGVSMPPTYNWDYNVALYTCVDDEDEQELERIEEHNTKMRGIVFRDIRRPGRDYTELLKDLELVQGNRVCKKKFLDMCIHEARRFRRFRMAECMQEWWDLGNRIGDDPNKLYSPNDGSSPAPMSPGTYPGDGFMGISPSSGLYMSSGISSVYDAEFSHNNNHFAEGLEDPFQAS